MKFREELMPEYPDYYEPDYTGRPIEYVKDEAGNCWLCDLGTNKDGNLEKQGCWRCEDLAFPFGGH